MRHGFKTRGGQRVGSIAVPARQTQFVAICGTAKVIAEVRASSHNLALKRPGVRSYEHFTLDDMQVIAESSDSG